MQAEAQLSSERDRDRKTERRIERERMIEKQREIDRKRDRNGKYESQRKTWKLFYKYFRIEKTRGKFNKWTEDLVLGKNEVKMHFQRNGKVVVCVCVH